MSGADQAKQSVADANADISSPCIKLHLADGFLTFTFGTVWSQVIASICAPLPYKWEVKYVPECEYV